MDDYDWNSSLENAIGVIREDTPEHECCRGVMEKTVRKLLDMKIKVITSEMVSEYKSRKASNCPHCGSNRISTSEDLVLCADDTAGIGATRGMVCENPDCEEEWIEIFKLDDIVKEDLS